MLPVGLMPKTQQQVPPEADQVVAVQLHIPARSRADQWGGGCSQAVCTGQVLDADSLLGLEGLYSTSSSCVGEGFMSIWPRMSIC